MKGHEMDPLITRICNLLDASTEALDESTRLRLDSIRLRALSSHPAVTTGDDGEERLLAAARVALDDSIHELDARVAARLDQSRHAAIQQTDERAVSGRVGDRMSLLTRWRTFFDTRRFALPAGALAGTGVLAIAFTLVYRQPADNVMDDIATDVLLFASSDEIELYDNLEFYLWLADNGLPN